MSLPKITIGYLALITTLSFLPFRIISVAGFEVTPSLLISFGLIVFISARRELGIVAVITFFIAIGLLFSIYNSNVRNAASAFISVHGLLFLFLGFELTRRTTGLVSFAKAICPAFVVLTLLLCIDVLLLGKPLRTSGFYAAVAYSSDEAAFINSIFPFYGKFGVLTFASICVSLLMFSLPALIAVKRKNWRYAGYALALVMVYFCFQMYSRQIYLGLLIFVVSLAFLAPGVKRKSLLFISVTIPLVLGILFLDDLMLYAPTKIQTTYDALQVLDFNSLTSGRMGIYAMAFSEIRGALPFIGCGFCDINSSYDFGFSSLHNVFLTAIFKGGFPLLLISIAPFAVSFLILRAQPPSLTRAIYQSAMISLLAQSMSWDLLFLQIVGPIIFCFTGFLMMMQRERPYSENPLISSEARQIAV